MAMEKHSIIFPLNVRHFIDNKENEPKDVWLDMFWRDIALKQKNFNCQMIKMDISVCKMPLFAEKLMLFLILFFQIHIYERNI